MASLAFTAGLGRKPATCCSASDSADASAAELAKGQIAGPGLVLACFAA